MRLDAAWRSRRGRPGHDALGREVDGLLGAAALAVDGGARARDSGQPAARTALRPTLRDCSATCMTHPHDHIVDRAGVELVAFGGRALSASDARSTACQLRSFPFRLPPGVRTASTMTAVDMGSSQVRWRGRTDREITHSYPGTPCTPRPWAARPPSDRRRMTGRRWPHRQGHGSLARRRGHADASSSSVASLDRLRRRWRGPRLGRGPSPRPSWRATRTGIIQAGIHGLLLDAR